MKLENRAIYKTVILLAQWLKTLRSGTQCVIGQHPPGQLIVGDLQETTKRFFEYIEIDSLEKKYSKVFHFFQT